MSVEQAMSGAEQELRDRVLRAVASEPSPTRRQRRTRSALLFAAAGGAALLIFVLQGGIRAQARPLWLMVETTTGSSLLAAAGLALALGRGRSMLSRAPAVLIAATVFLPLALIGWKVGVSALHDAYSAWPGRPGFRCLALALATGLFPLTAALTVHRGNHPLRPGVTGAAIGTACGLAAAVLVDLWCPVAHLPHLLLGHLLPLVVLAVAGGLAGARLLAPRLLHA